MHKLIEYTGGGSIIAGVFLSLYGVGWVNLLGISILVIDPIIIVSLRFYHLRTMKERFENLLGLLFIIGVILIIFSIPNPGCPAYTLCIPVPNFSGISLSDVAITSILAMAMLAVAAIASDLFLVFRRKE